MIEAVDMQGEANWGPACLGYRVSLPGGEQGRVDAVRVRDGDVELVVATSTAPRRLVGVRADEIDAILPGPRRIVVGDPGGVPSDGAAVETAGGILRLPPRNSLRIGSPVHEPA